MSEIDWSKAPEGFPIWVEDLGASKSFNGSGWHMEDGARYVDRHGHYWHKRDEGRQYRVHLPPTTAQWNGEGLPPVGCECEVLWTSATGEYARAVVVGYDHDNEYAVYRLVGGERCGEYESFRAGDIQGYPCFRPTRTPEQFAAEEREKACEEMLRIAKSRRSDPDVYEAIATLYDAGYRKQERAQ